MTLSVSSVKPISFQTNGENMATRSRARSFTRYQPFEKKESATTIRLPSICHPLQRSLSHGVLELTGKQQLTGPPNKHRRENMFFKNFELPENFFPLRDCPRPDFNWPKHEPEISSPPPIIPEGISTVEGAPEKTRLPVFGARADLKPRDSGMHTPHSTVSSVTRFDSDEMATSYREFRRLFLANDPESQGNLTREAFARVLTVILHRPITQHLISELLRVLGLRHDKQIVNWTEFYTALRNNNSMSERSDSLHSQSSRTMRDLPAAPRTRGSELSRAKSSVVDRPDRSAWLDPILRSERPLLAHQLMAVLKEKLRSKMITVDELLKDIPMAEGEDIDEAEEDAELATATLSRSELQARIAQIGLQISDSEFSKFWRRLDPSHGESITNELFLQQLCFVDMTPAHPTVQAPAPPSVTERKQTIITLLMSNHTDVTLEKHVDAVKQAPQPERFEHFVRQKLRKGLRRFKAALEQAHEASVRVAAQAPGNTEKELTRNIPLPSGWISADAFLAGLTRLKLPRLPKNQLPEFLFRCGLKPGPQGSVAYRDVLKVYQDRSEAGILHRVMEGQHKPAVPLNNAEVQQQLGLIDHTHLLESIEKKLLLMLHKDFIELLSAFRAADIYHQGYLPPSEFLQLVGKQFKLDFPEDYLEQLCDLLPMDRRGNVRYGEFLKQLDSKCVWLSPVSIFHIIIVSLQSVAMMLDECQQDMDKPDGQVNTNTTAVSDAGKQMNPEAEEKKAKRTKKKRRTVKVLLKLVKHIMDECGADVERKFRELDCYNSGRLTQDAFFELFGQFDIQPALTRGEVRLIWPHLLTMENNSLSFMELQRFCLHDPATATFPNAKLCPPRVGDTDRVPRSKHLNSDLDVIKLALRSKIDYMFEDVCKELQAMDPDTTGFISEAQFRTLLNELSLKFTEEEMSDIVKAYRTAADKINYMQFLKPFLHRRSIPRAGNDLRDLLPEPTFAATRFLRHIGKDGSFLHGISQVFKDVANQRQRSLKQADQGGRGRLEVEDLRALLNAGVGVRLTDEQVYQLLSCLDPQMSGTIPYALLLDEFERSLKVNKPNSKEKSCTESVACTKEPSEHDVL